VDYRSSGVDIDAAQQVVRRVKDIARKTFTSGVLSDIGSFGGLYEADIENCRQPVLVASADGVGTKLKVAFLADRHDTVGIDLVNHCVNDVLVQGARPLFFLDYLATGRLAPDIATTVIQGLADGCVENRCALLGGETAEMPGFYTDGEYDLAGFVVGIVDRAHLVDGRRIETGDVLIGLPSNGLHTNGFSLARQIIFEKLHLRVETVVDEFGMTVGDELLRTHRSYLQPVSALLEFDRKLVKGLAHITGGGLTDNLPRVLPPGTTARIVRQSWIAPPVFQFLQRQGEVPEDDMYRTFNMGIGMVLVVDSKAASAVLSTLAEAGESGAMLIGEVVEGDQQVLYV